MSEFWLLVIPGLISGCIYALAGSGLILVYSTSRVINFALGDIAVLALYVGLELDEHGLGYGEVVLATLVVSVVVTGLLGIFIIYGPGRRLSDLEHGTLTIALSLILSGSTLAVWGGSTVSFPSPGTSVLVGRILGVGISVNDLITAVLAVVIFAGLGWLLRYSRIGATVRAVSEDEEMSRLMGIATNRIILLSWIMSGLIVGVGAIMIIHVTGLASGSLDIIVVYGFVTIVLAGFDNVIGALGAGLTLGVIQNLVAGYVSDTAVLPIIFLLLAGCLFIAPTGVFSVAKRK